MNPCYSFLSARSFGVGDAVGLIFIVILIVFSAFFSATETAFSSVNTMHIKTYVDEKRKGARRAQYVIDHFDTALVSLLVGNNLVNIANTTLCAYLFSTFINNPTLSNVLNTVVMTIVILIFGEILPKCYAKHNSEKFVLKFSGAVFVFLKVIYIIAFPFMCLQKVFLKEKEVNQITEDDLENIVDTMEDQGVIDSENASIIHGALNISEQTVHDILVPRVDMVAIDVNATEKEIKDLFIEYQYSRIPVYDGDKDNIVGVLNFKDFVSLEYKNEKFDLKKIMQEPLKVTKTMKVDELIQTMQKTQKHLAIVIDEFGGTSGLVTMEDALEEMVGEIYDEHDDTEKAPVVKLEENKYDVNPDISVEDLFGILEIEHLPETTYPSVAGMIYELSESVPEKGTTVKITAIDDVLNEKNEYISMIADLTFVVDEVEDNRIKKVTLSIERREQPSEDD